jgi:hypothetical protein
MDNKKEYKLEVLLKVCNDENRHEEVITDIQGKEFPNCEDEMTDNTSK